METTDAKTAAAQRATYERYMLLHQERAHRAALYLDGVEHRYRHLGEIDQQELIDACVRMLIDLHLKKHPGMDLAATFLRYVLLMPGHMRIPFVNAVARCLSPGQIESLDDKAWYALRKHLHQAANKVTTLLYDLTMEFTDWQLEDPAQLEMFKTPVKADPPAGQVLDDGGVFVNLTTGEVE